MIRCGLSTTVSVCTAGDAFVVFDAFEEFVFAGDAMHADNKTAVKINAMGLMKSLLLK